MAFEPIRLSTEHLPRQGRNDIIRDYYGKIAQRTELELIAGEDAHIDVEAHLYSGLTVGGGEVGSMWGHRTASMRSDGNSDIVLSFALNGAIIREAGRHDVTVRPGDAMLTALDRPISLFMPARRNRFVTVQLGRDLLSPLVPGVDDRVSASLDARAPAMQLLKSYATTVVAHPPSDDEARGLAGRHLAQLAALAIGAGADGQHLARREGVPAARLAAAKALIQRQLDDPHLSAATVAQRLGVSVRYLHMLFEAEQHSFSTHVAHQRLRRAMALLTNPALSHWRIIDIALEAGFADVRTFNRAFRREFGCTPGEARKA